MKAFIFPGQGAQFSGMGRHLYETSNEAKALFEQANDLLGFSITDIMFQGTAADLVQTKVTQPAVFIHSVVAAQETLKKEKPAMVAGHSLGEFSALVTNQTLDFSSALKLVQERALAMQEACEVTPSTMAAILGLTDAQVKMICQEIEGVSTANYNCPKQVVISGSVKSVEKACALAKQNGAKRALPLSVSGGFHSAFMQPAADRLTKIIENTPFQTPSCPIYQNVVAKAVVTAEEIKQNLIAQLTGSVRWTQTVQQMIADGATSFTEFGPGKVLQGLVKKIDASVTVNGIE